MKKIKPNITLEIIPYGCGWEDIYLNIEGVSLYFSVSTVQGSSIQQLLRLLYYLYPRQEDPCHADDLQYYYGIRAPLGDSLHVAQITEQLCEEPLPYGFEEIPFKGSFEWDEEGAKSLWTVIRPPTNEPDFSVSLQITLLRETTVHYSFQLPYKDLCYAVAKACTALLKTYGLYGYHHMVYDWDMNLRYLLFLKGIALDQPQVRVLHPVKGKPNTATSLEQELNLLLTEMD